jgi:hypothetical protein
MFRWIEVDMRTGSWLRHLSFTVSRSVAPESSLRSLVIEGATGAAQIGGLFFALRSMFKLLPPTVLHLQRKMFEILPPVYGYAFRTSGSVRVI